MTPIKSNGILFGVWWNVVLLFASLAAYPFDRREILGLNPWIKPLKFEISVIIFLVTVGLLMRIVSEQGRWRKLTALLGWGFAISMIVENTAIAMQSARGVRSHMNVTTPFDGAVFGVMGLFIIANTVLLAVLLLCFCLISIDRPPAELWGIRTGLALILAGSLEGVVMIAHFAHTVGGEDGGPGLPFFNWSTSHGDLRVAHFFALHALQLLWAIGWIFGRTKWPTGVTVAATLAAAGSYLGFVCLLFSQAMAGKPLLP